MSELSSVMLFDGLAAETVAGIVAHARTGHYRAGSFICREGDPGDSLFVMREGVARVLVGDGTAVTQVRRGDVIGEMSLLTEAPRSASVVAVTDTEVLELDRSTFVSALGAHPALLTNLVRILSARLARTTLAGVRRAPRGEAVALVVAPEAARLLPAIARATAAASPGPVEVIDCSPGREPVGDGLGRLDDALARNRAVLLVVRPEALGALDAVLPQADRVVAIASASAPPEGLEGPAARRPIEVVAVGAAKPAGNVVRHIRDNSLESDVAWVGRHLARTKLGLALGAGGAKGYAHVGVLQVLQDAGYVVDAVAGSSIGAIVGAVVGLGRDAAGVDGALRARFTPETVAGMFSLSFAGTSAGGSEMLSALEALVGDATFADLAIPVVAMAVDLDARTPVPICDGPIVEALRAATALAGFVPPHVRAGRRLIDALALVPVPTDAVVTAGADVTLSVNIMSAESLPCWPGQPPPEPPAARKQRMLDVLLDVMDMAQFEASARHAARADIVVTPRFGPSTWRDFHLADLFIAAGRLAAEEQLPRLRDFARPQPQA